MKVARILLATAVLASMAGLAYVGQRAEPSGGKMVEAAQKFLESLGDKKERATFAFNSKERTNWFFVPLQDKEKKPTRKGVGLYEMNDAQRQAALELLAAGTSSVGKKKALTVMSLEGILHELEKKGTNVRSPGWYFFTVFGTPSKSDKWGWRVEGHHLSLNFTLDGNQVVTATPSFFGANPAEIKTGDKKGYRTLEDSEDLARKLFQSLSQEQQGVAYRKQNFPEIQQAKEDPEVEAPVGLPASKMTGEQKETLLKLLQTYTSRMPEDVRDTEMKMVREAGLDKIHFAYAGGVEKGQPHSYRVQGPTFVIMFLNVQTDPQGNAANHIHSVWRRIDSDFGLN
jgi:hypothetical protein